MDVGGVVDDEYSVPHHGEVDGEVADVAALIVVLRKKKRKTQRQRVRKCCFIKDAMQIEDCMTFHLIYIVMGPACSSAIGGAEHASGHKSIFTRNRHIS